VPSLQLPLTHFGSRIGRNLSGEVPTPQSLALSIYVDAEKKDSNDAWGGGRAGEISGFPLRRYRPGASGPAHRKKAAIDSLDVQAISPEMAIYVET
jgi:hypothetical protein